MARRPRLKVKVRDKDRGWRRLRRQVFKPAQFVTVGVHGEDESRAGGGIGNVELATVHEFGSSTANIPARSFIRKTIDENYNTYRRFITVIGNQVYTLKLTTRAALEIIGAKVAADMRRTIQKTPGDWAPLKPATLAAREYGGTKPLIDRGELIRSIKHKIFA